MKPACRKCKEPLEVFKRRYLMTTYTSGYCRNNLCKMRHLEVLVSSVNKEKQHDSFSTGMDASRSMQGNTNDIQAVQTETKTA